MSRMKMSRENLMEPDIKIMSQVYFPIITEEKEK